MTPALVDPRAARFNQGATGVLLLVAYVAGAPGLVPALGLVLGLAALAGPKANLWGVLFARVVTPALKLGPPARMKDAAPARFAMGVGFAFLAAATAVLYLAPAALGGSLGWGLALVVAALALLAAATDICVGCEMYVLLQRLRAKSTA